MERFTWAPGTGPDLDALRRIEKFFPRPAEPMGEAWFMGEKRRMFGELCGDLDLVSAEQLQKPLEEIVSGFTAFGAQREWVDWYHYLLGALIRRGHEGTFESLFEYLITGLIGCYPNGIDQEPYKGFRRDVMDTLGRCIMDRQGWSGSEVVIGNLLHRSNSNPAGVWQWWDASGDFSASFFLCLKFLPAHTVAPWFRSALEIKSAHWRAQLIVWLIGAHRLLEDDTRWPAEDKVGGKPSVGWAWSHCLRSNMASNPKGGALVGNKPTFIPREHSLAAREALRSYLTIDRYIEWLDSMKPYPYLIDEMEGLPQMFENLYLPSKMR